MIIILKILLLLVCVNSSGGSAWQLHKFTRDVEDGQESIYLLGTNHFAHYADTVVKGIEQTLKKEKVDKLNEIFAEVSPDDQYEFNKRVLEAYGKHNAGGKFLEDYVGYMAPQVKEGLFFDNKLVNLMQKSFNCEITTLDKHKLEYDVEKLKKQGKVVAESLVKYAKEEKLDKLEVADFDKYVEKTRKYWFEPKDLTKHDEWVQTKHLEYFAEYNKYSEEALSIPYQIFGRIAASSVKRNKLWVPELMASAKNGTVFGAVGAGHLRGHEGLISLLKKEKFTYELLHLDLEFSDDQIKEREEIEDTLPKMQKTMLKIQAVSYGILDFLFLGAPTGWRIMTKLVELHNKEKYIKMLLKERMEKEKAMRDDNKL